MPYFIIDDRGTLAIPVRLMVYVIITTAIVAVSITGLQHLKPGIADNTIDKQAVEIGASLNIMQYGAARNLVDPASPPGNMRTFRITIPTDVEYVAFGADPDPDNDGDLTNTKEGLTTERGNVIFYVSRAGKKRVPLDENIELREGLLDNGRWVINNAKGKQYGFIITGRGKHEVTFELVYDPVVREMYTLGHFTDDIDAYINPYRTVVLPNSLWVSLDPKSIPADGTTEANISVQLKDKNGVNAEKDGVEINLSVSYGNLSSGNLTTVKGRAAAHITADSVGTIVISASSPGLNQGSAYLTVTQVPIIIDFDEWINDSRPHIRQFNTEQELRYDVYLTGSGIEFFEWPNASIEINGTRVGEEAIDNPRMIKKNIPPGHIASREPYPGRQDDE